MTGMTGILAMLGASVCFSTGGLLIKLIPWNPLAINGVRNLIACGVLGAAVVISGVLFYNVAGALSRRRG